MTPAQAALAAKLGNAPPNTILIYDKKINLAEWGLVCTNDKKTLTVARVSYGGAWQCGSMSTADSRADAETFIKEDGVIAVITPDDPAYQGKIERLMLDMLQ